jgi:hypothetical protein
MLPTSRCRPRSPRRHGTSSAKPAAPATMIRRGRSHPAIATRRSWRRARRASSTSNSTSDGIDAETSRGGSESHAIPVNEVLIGDSGAPVANHSPLFGGGGATSASAPRVMERGGPNRAVSPCNTTSGAARTARLTASSTPAPANRLRATGRATRRYALAGNATVPAQCGQLPRVEIGSWTREPPPRQSSRRSRRSRVVRRPRSPNDRSAARSSRPPAPDGTNQGPGRP